MAAAKTEQDRIGTVVEAILTGGFDKAAVTDQLKTLDLATEVEDVDISPRGVSIDGGRFTAEGVVYIQLGSIGEELPISFQGHFSKDGNAVVDRTSVDTSHLFRSSFRPAS